MGLGPLLELVANLLGVVGEANLIGAGTLILVLEVVTHHLVADDHALQKLIELGVSPEFIDVGLDELSLVDPVIQGQLLEDHLVGSKGACLVRQQV